MRRRVGDRRLEGAGDEAVEPLADVAAATSTRAAPASVAAGDRPSARPNGAPAAPRRRRRPTAARRRRARRRRRRTGSRRRARRATSRSPRSPAGRPRRAGERRPHRGRRREQQQAAHPAAHHPLLQVGVGDDAQRHAVVVVEQRRIADHPVAVALASTIRGSGPDVPRRDPGALGERERRRPPPRVPCVARRARIAARSVSASRAVPCSSSDEHVHPQVRRQDARGVEVVAADAHAADLGDRRGEGVDEPAVGGPRRCAAAGRSRRAGSARGGCPWAACARAPGRARRGSRGSASRAGVGRPG